MDSFIRSLRRCLSTPERIQRILEQRSINEVPKLNVKVIGLLKEVLLLTNKNSDNFWPLLLVLKIIEEGLKHTYNSEDWSKINESFGGLINIYFRTVLMYEHHFLATHKSFNTFLTKAGKCFLTLIETNESLRIIVLIEAFGVILNLIFANSFDFFVRKEVFLQLKTILKRADAELRKKILHNYDKSLTKLAEWFPECGDYETEEVAVEILMRLSFMSKQKINVMKHWFRNCPLIIPAVDVLNYKSFDMSCREFLNIVNITVDTETKVITLPCVDAFANDIRLHKPKSEQCKKLWVDFSMRTGIIQTICDGGDNAWLSLVVEQPNVKAIICKSKSHRYQNTDFDCKDIVIELVTPLVVNLYSEERYILSVTLIFLETSKFDRLQECFFMNCYKDLYSIERGQSFELLSKAFLNRGKHKQKQAKPTIYASTPKSGHRITSFSKLGDEKITDDVRSTLSGSTSISRISSCHEQERNIAERSESPCVQYVQSKNTSLGGKSSCAKLQVADCTSQENDKKFVERVEQLKNFLLKETRFVGENIQSLLSNQKHLRKTEAIEGNLQDRSKFSVYQDSTSKEDGCQEVEKKQEDQKMPIISKTFTKHKEKGSMYQKCDDKSIICGSSGQEDTSLNPDEDSPFVMLIDPKMKPNKPNEGNRELARGANFNQYRVYEDIPSDKSASSSSSRPSLRYTSKPKNKRFVNEEVNAQENQQEIISKPFDKIKSGTLVPLANRSNGQSSIHLPHSKEDVSSKTSESATFSSLHVPVVIENVSFDRASNITLISLHSGGREEIQLPRGSHSRSEDTDKTTKKRGDTSCGTALAIKADRPTKVSAEINIKQDRKGNRNDEKNESIDGTDSDVPLALRLNNAAKKSRSKSKENATTKSKYERKSLKVNRNKTTPQKLEEQLKRLSSKNISSNEKTPSTSNKLEDRLKRRISSNDSGSILFTLKPSKTYARKNKTGGPATFRRTPEILFDDLVEQRSSTGMSKKEDNDSIKMLGKKRKLYNPNASFEEIIIINSERTSPPGKRPKRSTSPEKRSKRSITHPMSKVSNKVASKKFFPSHDADVAQSNMNDKNSKKNRHTLFYVSTSSSDESRSLIDITPRNSKRSLRPLPKKNYKECSSDETHNYNRGGSVERMKAIHEEVGADEPCQIENSGVMREQDGRRERELDGSPASFEERRPSEVDKLILDEEPTMGALEEHRVSTPPRPVPPVSDPAPLRGNVFHFADERKSLEKFVEQLSESPLSENKENILNQVAALKECLFNLEKETSVMGQEITMRYFEVQKCLESMMGSYNRFASFFGNESKAMNLKLQKLANEL